MEKELKKIKRTMMQSLEKVDMEGVLRGEFLCHEDIPNIYPKGFDEYFCVVGDDEKKYGMSTAKIEFENPYGGLKIPKDQLMKQGAEYIAKGGGEYKIKMKKGVKIVTSRKNIKTIEFKDLEIDIKKEEGGQETILSILKEIFR